jgi:N6-adenosine-specific RNA methylase IME4
MKNPDFTESSGTGTVSLTRYDAACSALAEARSVDDVKDIRNQAIALETYARLAKDRTLINDATDIRLRAELRLGEMILAQKETIGLNRGLAGSRVSGTSKEPLKDERPTLAENGIDKKLSARVQHLARLSPEERELRFSASKKEAVAHIEMPRKARMAGKKRLRAEREVELGAKILALPQKRYGVILADPPWRYTISSDCLMSGCAADHYLTSDLETIKALDVPSIVADASVLFLWATGPMLPEAVAVMDAWGFAYKSQMVWVKDRIGTGYWLRSRHENLLIGTRGDIPSPSQGTQPDSVFEARRGRHSEKPSIVHEMIERMFPSLPKIELYARAARPGWSCWGNEAPATLEMERAS